MPTFITENDVVTALSMETVDADTYLLYGEKIAKTAVQSHVNYANDYVSVYTGDIDSTSSKWIPARLAALCLAMKRTVVVALGWTVYDNVNYQVGEIEVNVGPQLEQVIRSNLAAWEADFNTAMNTLISGMVVAAQPFGQLLNQYLKQGYTLYESGAEP
ncbi:MAG: hypothetical protein QW069_08655 [Candidatus Caldarchaeum sp.]